MNQWAPPLVYLLCFLTSTGCAVLLLRSYLRSNLRLLLWSGICFTLLAANNLVVIFDMILLRENDLRLLRLAFALAAVSVLLFGFIWEQED